MSRNISIKQKTKNIEICMYNYEKNVLNKTIKKTQKNK